jgi:DNA-binding transcriptional ArsR family regulator
MNSAFACGCFDGNRILMHTDLLLVARAIACPSRLFVLQLLGNTGICVSEVARKAGLSPATACHHLKVLASAGLAVRVRRGRRTIYRWSATRCFLTFRRSDTQEATDDPKLEPE